MLPQSDYKARHDLLHFFLAVLKIVLTGKQLRFTQIAKNKVDTVIYYSFKFRLEIFDYSWIG